jgi:hypothetical protein
MTAQPLPPHLWREHNSCGGPVAAIIETRIAGDLGIKCQWHLLLRRTSYSAAFSRISLPRRLALSSIKCRQLRRGVRAPILVAVLDIPDCGIDRLLVAQPQGVGNFATLGFPVAKWQRQVVPTRDSGHVLARLGTRFPKRVAKWQGAPRTARLQRREKTRTAASNCLLVFLSFPRTAFPRGEREPKRLPESTHAPSEGAIISPGRCSTYLSGVIQLRAVLRHKHSTVSVSSPCVQGALEGASLADEKGRSVLCSGARQGRNGWWQRSCGENICNGPYGS